MSRRLWIHLTSPASLSWLVNKSPSSGAKLCAKPRAMQARRQARAGIAREQLAAEEEKPEANKENKHATVNATAQRHQS
eukprot:4214354-Amphidinium_carterae.1